MPLTVGNPDSEVRTGIGYTMWHCTIPLRLTSRSGFAHGPRAQQLYRLGNLYLLRHPLVAALLRDLIKVDCRINWQA